ncbi:MAG: hypothetical protein WCJ76_15655 [Comamonadaceae bacterium]
MTLNLTIRRAWQATAGDLIDLALSQPHQVLLSTGSVAFMAQFAAHGGIVDPMIGYLIAGGVEWAYLRGLASNAKTPTIWGDILNWSAFGITVLWGVLWVASVYGAFSPQTAAASGGAWWLAIAHVVPVAWLSLCAVMTHGAAARAETLRSAQREAEQTNWEAEQANWQRNLERERATRMLEIETRTAAQQAKRALDATMPVASTKMPAEAVTEAKMPLVCPACGASLTTGQYGAAKRWGRCASCKRTAT